MSKMSQGNTENCIENRGISSDTDIKTNCWEISKKND
jgi:hypothetical protein